MQEQELELVVFVGIPASGKSTMAKQYKEQGYIILSSDELREKTEQEIADGRFVLPSNTNLNSFVFESLKAKAKQLLREGKSIVLDATNLGRKRRMNFLRVAVKTKCHKKCIIFITEPDECYKRNAQRQGYARVPDEAMYKMCCNFECPNYWEGWDEIVPFAQKEEYAFDMNLLVGFSQDNPYHTLTLDEHMKKTHAIAVENGFSERIQKIALIHDIGKYYTKKFENSKGEKTERAHFYGHENYGAYLYLVQSCAGKQLSQDQWKTVLDEVCLINCHMRPLTVWRDNDRARENDKRTFGTEFYEQIVALNKCDRIAH